MRSSLTTCKGVSPTLFCIHTPLFILLHSTHSIFIFYYVFIYISIFNWNVRSRTAGTLFCSLLYPQHLDIVILNKHFQNEWINEWMNVIFFQVTELGFLLLGDKSILTNIHVQCSSSSWVARAILYRQGHQDHRPSRMKMCVTLLSNKTPVKRAFGWW